MKIKIFLVSINQFLTNKDNFFRITTVKICGLRTPFAKILGTGADYGCYNTLPWRIPPLVQKQKKL